MARWTHLIAGTLAVALIACGRPAEEAPLVEKAPPRAAAPAAPPLAPLAPLEWAPFKDHLADSLFGARADSADLGIGLVALQMPGMTGRPARADTLYFRAAPRADAAPVAALVLELVDSTSWRYAMLGPPGTRINVEEYAYEESGVPVDSIEGRWARGIVGWAPSGARVTGWANAADTARVELIRWTEHLRERAWYVLHRDRTRIFASLADTSAPGDTLPDEFDLEPIETRGRWMRVRLMWPYDKCNSPDSANATRREAWLEYLDRRGRPRVFYPSRGC